MYSEEYEVTYSSNDESHILIRVKVADRRIQRRGKGVLKQPSKIRILQSTLHILNDFLPRQLRPLEHKTLAHLDSTRVVSPTPLLWAHKRQSQRPR
jgi:hypothetical protein